jgi:prolyl oligopeptidase PreP (S9A serine peptidase family)
MVNVEEGARGWVSQAQIEEMKAEALGVYEHNGYLIDRAKFKESAGSYPKVVEIWEYHGKLNEAKRIAKEKKAGIMHLSERHYFYVGLWNAIMERVRRVRREDLDYWMQVKTQIPSNPVVDILSNPIGTAVTASTQWLTSNVVVPATTGIVQGTLQGLGLNLQGVDWKKIGIIAVAGIGSLLAVYAVIKFGSKVRKRRR